MAHSSVGTGIYFEDRWFRSKVMQRWDCHDQWNVDHKRKGTFRISLGLGTLVSILTDLCHQSHFHRPCQSTISMKAAKSKTYQNIWVDGEWEKNVRISCKYDRSNSMQSSTCIALNSAHESNRLFREKFPSRSSKPIEWNAARPLNGPAHNAGPRIFWFYPEGRKGDCFLNLHMNHPSLGC